VEDKTTIEKETLQETGERGGGEAVL